MKILSRLIALLLLPLSPCQISADDTPRDKTVVLFAASSTMEAIETIKIAYERQHPSVKIRVSYGASALLARQISMGAPADLFLSANINWINWLEKNKTSMSAPIVIAGNGLTLISPKNSKLASCPHTVEDFNALVGDKRFVIADPNVSPLGQYTKETLLLMGVWENIEPRLVIAGNANLVVKMIERGAAPYGFAYASSATNNDAIKVLCPLTSEGINPIKYYLVKTHASQDVESFANFLLYDGGEYFKKAGFSAYAPK